MPLEGFLRDIKGFLKDSQIVLDRETLSHFSYDATERQFMPQVAVLPENGSVPTDEMRLGA